MSDVVASVAGGDVAAAGVAHAVVVGVGYVAVARALMLWILLGASEMILSKSKMLTASPLGIPTNTRYGDLSTKFGIMAKRRRVVSSKTYPYIAEIVPGVRAIIVDQNYRTHRQCP